MKSLLNFTKNRNVLATLIACSVSAISAEAQDKSFKELTELCISISKTAENGFEGRRLAQPLADKLEALAQEASKAGKLLALMPYLNGRASACVGYARQIKSATFDVKHNRYVPRSAIFAEKEAATLLQAAAARLRAENRLKMEQLLMESEVDSRVYEACSKLAAADPVKAFTNELCVRSFKVNGLPK
jgi:hypothetical protein